MQHNEPTVTARFVLGPPGTAPRHVPIDRRTLTIGRRTHNDISLQDLTVSGEHAVVRTSGVDSVIHDLGSRNGTLVNGEPITQRLLRDGDVIEVGVYRLSYLAGCASVRPAVPQTAPATPPALAPDGAACLMVLGGAEAGHEIALSRPINRIGETSAQVAVVARRHGGWVITHLEGLGRPLVNGAPIGPGAHALVDGDLIELAGTLLQFRLAR